MSTGHTGETFWKMDKEPSFSPGTGAPSLFISPWASSFPVLRWGRNGSSYDHLAHLCYHIPCRSNWGGSQNRASFTITPSPSLLHLYIFLSQINQSYCFCFPSFLSAGCSSDHFFQIMTQACSQTGLLWCSGQNRNWAGPTLGPLRHYADLPLAEPSPPTAVPHERWDRKGQ